MTRIERFEELIAWQRARELVRSVYAVTSSGPFVHDRSLKDQIRRASVSVMSNVAEGFERGGRAEFAHFLSTAKASCGETRSLLYVAVDAGYLDEIAFQQLRQTADEVGRIVGGLRVSVARQRDAQSPSRRP